MAKSREQYINEKMDNEAVSFNLVDQHTVERLKRDGIIEVPTKKLDVPKDMRWNEKYIASQMLKGIENGDSVDKMASSIFLEIFSREDTFNLTEKGVSDLIKRCHNSAIRNARTMTTSAENHGRLDSYKDLAAKGVVQKKEWMSTPDDRTRPSHVDIDGEEQDIDKVFSNGCMFPGDGKGPAEEVWMCRCTMTDHIIGFRRADGSISKVNYTPDRTLHDEQMEELRVANAKEKTLNNRFKNNAERDKIRYIEVNELDKTLTEKQIINKIAGEDKTKGSCASQTFAYVANKCGLDVKDYRGGKSRELFSRNFHKVLKMTDADIKVYKVKKEVSEVASIISKVELNKEYILAAGKHMTVIKRTNTGLQYLELQADGTNGWTSFGKTTNDIKEILKDRFGCRKTVVYKNGKQLRQTVILTDVDSVKPTDEFREVLGYLNTNK